MSYNDSLYILLLHSQDWYDLDDYMAMLNALNRVNFGIKASRTEGLAALNGVRVNKRFGVNERFHEYSMQVQPSHASILAPMSNIRSALDLETRTAEVRGETQESKAARSKDISFNDAKKSFSENLKLLWSYVDGSRPPNELEKVGIFTRAGFEGTYNLYWTDK